MNIEKKILELAEKVKNPPSWWWKVLGGVLLFIFALWIRHLLVKKSEELSAARLDLAELRMQAQRAETSARLESNDEKRKTYEQTAKDTWDRFLAKEKDIQRAYDTYRTNVAQITAVENKDWVALNVLAGIDKT